MSTPKWPKAIVKKQRDVRMHSELWHTSNCLLNAGQQSAEGSAHQFRASLVFRAFALEAFLNWLGPQLIPHWQYLERLKPREKLDLLTDLIKVKPDYASRPWQIVKELFDFRNKLGHGKSETLEIEDLEDAKEFLEGKSDFARTNWENFANERNALRAKDDVETIATLLYEKAELKHRGPRGPFTFGFQTRGMNL